MKTAIRITTTLAILLLAGPAAHGHQEDTSYTRVGLQEDRIRTVVTFDLHVLQRIALIDQNQDDVITRVELASAASLLQTYFQDHIALSLNDGPPSLGEAAPPVLQEDVDSTPGPEWAQTLVDFPFERPLERHPDLLTLDYRTWFELGPSHTNLTSIAQTGYDDVEIVFNADQPDYDFFTEAPTSPFAQFAQFVRLGAQHIWAGLDHILFLVALLVVSRLRELLQIVTAFTVAHSITLALAVLEIVELPSRWVEASIAATIVWVAYQNLRGRTGAHRWRLTFAFGLVHGFGFAGVLRELELPAAGLLRSLAGFNVGVELGQVVIVAALFPVIALLRQTRLGTGAITGVSAAVGIAGIVWLVERVLPS